MADIIILCDLCEKPLIQVTHSATPGPEKVRSWRSGEEIVGRRDIDGFRRTYACERPRCTFRKTITDAWRFRAMFLSKETGRTNLFAWEVDRSKPVLKDRSR